VTWIDFIPPVLLIVYGVLGFFTGVLRRIISLLSLYVACIAATGMGLQAGGLIQSATGLVPGPPTHPKTLCELPKNLCEACPMKMSPTTMRSASRPTLIVVPFRL